MSFETAVEGSGREIQAALEALRRSERLGPLPMLAAPHLMPEGRRSEVALACEGIRSALLRASPEATRAPDPSRW